LTGAATVSGAVSRADVDLDPIKHRPDVVAMLSAGR
jgi:hypothetical protein